MSVEGDLFFPGKLLIEGLHEMDCCELKPLDE
jgi:hypothetical protein